MGAEPYRHRCPHCPSTDLRWRQSEPHYYCKNCYSRVRADERVDLKAA